MGKTLDEQAVRKAQAFLPDPLAGEAAIEPMLPEDLPQVLRIEEASFPSPWTREMFEAEFHGPTFARQRVVCVKRPDGARQILGYACYWILFDELHLLDLAVHPALRRRGLGSLLLEAILQEGAEAGAARALLEVRASNTAAHKLYGRFGFRLIAVRKGYYRSPREDGWVMERERLEED
jgi:ribosomal-protein-alanine N-acetyltransferase